MKMNLSPDETSKAAETKKKILEAALRLFEEKGFDDLVIGYTLHYQPPENNMDAEPDTEGKEYTGILSDIPTLSEFK